MDFGDALQELLNRGFSLDEGPPPVLTGPSGNSLYDPTKAELVQLATGMTIDSVKKERETRSQQ